MVSQHTGLDGAWLILNNETHVQFFAVHVFMTGTACACFFYAINLTLRRKENGIIRTLYTAVGLSMDAFAVSVCKGLAMPKISVRKAGIVGLWFGGFQALMPALGYLLGLPVP